MDNEFPRKSRDFALSQQNGFSAGECGNVVAIAVDGFEFWCSKPSSDGHGPEECGAILDGESALHPPRLEGLL